MMTSITALLFETMTTILLVITIFAAIIIALMLMISGIGYLMTFILPLNFFQSSELSAIMAIFGAFLLYAVHRTTSGFSEREETCTCEFCSACGEPYYAATPKKRTKVSKKRKIYDN